MKEIERDCEWKTSVRIITMACSTFEMVSGTFALSGRLITVVFCNNFKELTERVTNRPLLSEIMKKKQHLDLLIGNSISSNGFWYSVRIHSVCFDQVT